MASPSTPLMNPFTPVSDPEPLHLSEDVQVPVKIMKYLAQFQVDAVKFIFNNYKNGGSTILNDQSLFGKGVVTTVFLGAVATSKCTLIIIQNHNKFVRNWMDHLKSLTKLSFAELKPNFTGPLTNVTIAKWTTLRERSDMKTYNFDFIIVDDRGEMLDDYDDDNNDSCMSMLMNSFERKVNIFISSLDITGCTKLLHYILRLIDRLEPEDRDFKVFDAKFNSKPTQYLLCDEEEIKKFAERRKVLTDYCKEFRLRRIYYPN